MALSDISSAHVKNAMARFDAGEFDPRFAARKYAIRHAGKQYPPKWILSLAHEVAMGTRLDVSTFNGGAQANTRLTKLGFEIVVIAKDAAWEPPAGTTPQRTAHIVAPAVAPRTVAAAKVPLVTPAPSSPIDSPKKRSSGENAAWTLRIGLVLHEYTPARQRRLRDALVDGQGRGLDLLLFPETYEQYKNQHQADEIVAAYGSLARANQLAIAVGVYGPVVAGGDGGQQLWLFPADGGSPTRYVKHTTTGFSALEMADYAIDKQLPVVNVAGVGVGMTLCHDHYISPLQESLVRRGAQVLLNPSDDTNRSAWRKWTVVQRARAIENAAYSFCTVRLAKGDNAHLWAVCPTGDDVLLQQWKTKSAARPAHEVRMDGAARAGLPIWWAEIGPGAAPHMAPGIEALCDFKGDYMTPFLEVSIDDRGLRLGKAHARPSATTTTIRLADGPEVTVIRLTESDLMSPVHAWTTIRRLFVDGEAESVLVWLPLESAPEVNLTAIAASRALELCVPIVLTHDGRLWMFALVGDAKLTAGAMDVQSIVIPYAVAPQGKGFSSAGSSAYVMEPFMNGAAPRVGRERCSKFFEVLKTLARQ